MHAMQMSPSVIAPNASALLASWFTGPSDGLQFPIRRHQSQSRRLFTPRLITSIRQVRTLRSREPGSPSITLLTLISVTHRNLGTGRCDGLGIDLEKRGLEVRKLFYAAFARGLVKDGYDPEEALQEIYRGLLARNLGRCPFDASKSSFGHYVHIVARCVLANYIRKEKRRGFYESNESQLSVPGEDQFSIQDVCDLRVGTKIEPGSLEELSRSISVSTGSRPVGTGSPHSIHEALQMLADGHPRRKVCAMLGVESHWLDTVLQGAKAHLLG